MLPNNDGDVTEVPRTIRATVWQSEADLPEGVTGSIFQPTYTKNIDTGTGRVVGERWTGPATSFRVEAPQPSRLEQLRRWWLTRSSQRQSEGMQQPPEQGRGSRQPRRQQRRLPVVPGEEVRVYTSWDEYLRDLREANNRGLPFHGKFQGLSISIDPRDPNFEQKLEEFQREVRRGPRL